MADIGTFEAKTRLSELLERVARGERIIITRRGVPVARLIPAGAVDTARVRGAVARLKTFARGQRLRGVSWRTLRDEGRR